MALKETLGFDRDPVFLVDGSAFLYRGYYAFADMTRSDGVPTNALFSVLRLLLKLLREQKPSHLVFFLDGKGPNFRSKLYAEYKANRQAMPEPLAVQIPPLLAGVRLLGLTVIVPEDAEADDGIASLAAKFKGERPVVIVGADKDLKQCLDDAVVLYDPSGKAEKLETRKDFEAGYGIVPATWPEVQALVGDTADNIPGVAGIGEKTALELLRAHPTLETVLAHLSDLRPALRKKLEPSQEAVFLYRELARLRTDILRELTLEDTMVRPPDTQALADFLATWELRTLIREAAGLPPGPLGPRGGDDQTEPKAQGGQLSLFAAPSGEIGASSSGAGELTAISAADLPDPAGQTLGLVPLPQGFRVAGADFEQLVTGPALALAERLAQAQRLAVPSVKDLFTRFPAFEAVPLGRFFDLGLAAYLLAPDQRNYGFDRLRDSLTSDPAVDASAIRPEDQARAARLLAEVLSERLAAAKLTDLIAHLELPLIPVLVRMERHGLGLDLPALSAFLDEVGADLARLTQETLALAGRPFNPRSSQQLAEVLFDDLGLARQGKTPGGAPSTSQEALERLAGSHPLVDKILEFRKLEKLRSTYLEPLPRLVDAAGRVHTTLNQLAAATGRLSSSNPNLQNIPARGPYGRRMRQCFVAGPGNLLATADYSQIELRVLAHLSGEDSLVAAFAHGADIHARTAALLFDKPEADIMPEERRGAKTINFGLLYGMGPQKLSRDLGITLTAAKAFIEKYFARLPGLGAFYESVVAGAREHGFVTTLAGRRRLLPDIDSRNTQLAAQAKRQAINTVVQGGAADIIKMAMLVVDADAELANLNARLVLQIHDELLLEAPEGRAREAGRLAGLMTGVIDLRVPLEVDWGVGRTWGEAH